METSDVLRRVIQAAYCMDYDEYLFIMGREDDDYAKGKWDSMQSNFSRWYCELDYASASRFVRALENRDGLCAHTGRRVAFELTFQNTDGTFSAIENANAWAKAHSYNVGSMCCNEPIVFSKKYTKIPKWINLGNRIKSLCDGIFISGDFREGSVVARIYR